MGICGKKKNETSKNNQKPSREIIYEAMMLDSPMIPIEIVIEVSKSVCRIHTHKQIATGFLIKLIKEENPFYCLITNEHVINKEMIEQKQTINIYYDNRNEERLIELNTDERFIKNF